MKLMCAFLFLFHFFFLGASTAYSVDLIVFSYNRPLQLYAFLESSKELVTGIRRATVIYRADSDDFQNCYAQVKEKFSDVNFVRQSINNPYEDFKKLTLDALESADQHVIFAVDDIIVKEPIDLLLCAQALEQTGAYGFYLRLGKNVDECYSESCYQGIPPLTEFKDGIYSWYFSNGRCDWAYPNSLDMVLYRKSTIFAACKYLAYNSPNSLEGRLATEARPPLSCKGLCFTNSKIVNIPLNVVQHDWGNYEVGNRNMRLYSTAQLLDLFKQGLKIDIKKLRYVKNKSAHMEYVPTFITR